MRRMVFALDPASVTLRRAVPSDLGAVDALLRRSYPRLLAADYPPSVMVTALPLIARARPDLLASGRYYLLWQGTRLLGAGGFSLSAPAHPEAPSAAEGGEPFAHVRHVATDPEAVRQGVGRRLLAHVLGEARAAGAVEIAALSTRTAVPFYAAMAFRNLGERVIALAPGIDFPAVAMARKL
jgi:GNAT superfamily N-acetyltransferase